MFDALIMQHLEFKHPFDDVRGLATRCVAAAIDYLFGDWREGYNDWGTVRTAEGWRRRLPWIETYRYGLTTALILDDDEGIAQLASWPEPNSKNDDGTVDLTPQDIRYHLALARFLQDGDDRRYKRIVKPIVESSRRRPRNLLACLDAVAQGDAEESEACLTKFLRYFRKQEFVTNRVDYTISIEGSILWNVARRAGVELFDMDEPTSDMIVRAGTLWGK